MLKNLSQKQRELITYIFFGGLTTIVSLAVFGVCSYLLTFDVVTSNVISWIISVTFAYATNRRWVFESKKTGISAVGIEVASFFASRLFSGVLETVILYIAVDIMAFDKMLVKVIATVFVVVLNYILSKLIVFKKTNEGE